MGQAALGMPLLILLLLGILTVPNNSQAKGKNSLLFVQFCFNNFSAQPLVKACIESSDLVFMSFLIIFFFVKTVDLEIGIVKMTRMICHISADQFVH